MTDGVDGMFEVKIPRAMAHRGTSALEQPRHGVRNVLVGLGALVVVALVASWALGTVVGLIVGAVKIAVLAAAGAGVVWFFARHRARNPRR